MFHNHLRLIDKVYSQGGPPSLLPGQQTVFNGLHYSSEDYSESYPICLTPFRLKVGSMPLDTIQVPVGLICRVQNNAESSKVDIILKTCQVLSLKLENKSLAAELTQLITNIAFRRNKDSKQTQHTPPNQSYPFSFFSSFQQAKRYQSMHLSPRSKNYTNHHEDNQQGYFYEPLQQFNRMGIVFRENTSPLRVIYNQPPKVLCQTYPSLIAVPAKLTQKEVEESCQFRSRQRLPSLTFCYALDNNNHTYLFRCSQCKTGVLGYRSAADQNLVRLLGDLTQNPAPNCHIYDARSIIAAIGNRISGKGYESEEFYPNSKVIFLNIPNIHAVRSSFIKLLEAAQHQSALFYQYLEKSNWYQMICLLLKGACRIAKDLKVGLNVIVHCSDGWDRTAQLCALAQLLLDPYYRTIRGFCVLVQKDWVSFGHKFKTRLSLGVDASKNSEYSPIFTQFLDCVSQLVHQNPNHFQFNHYFLAMLSFCSHINLFGDFLYNSETEGITHQSNWSTVSVWDFLHKCGNFVRNGNYSAHLGYLKVNSRMPFMRFWRECHLNELPQEACECPSPIINPKQIDFSDLSDSQDLESPPDSELTRKSLISDISLVSDFNLFDTSAETETNQDNAD